MKCSFGKTYFLMCDWVYHASLHFIINVKPQTHIAFMIWWWPHNDNSIGMFLYLKGSWVSSNSFKFFLMYPEFWQILGTHIYIHWSFFKRNLECEFYSWGQNVSISCHTLLGIFVYHTGNPSIHSPIQHFYILCFCMAGCLLVIFLENKLRTFVCFFSLPIPPIVCVWQVTSLIIHCSAVSHSICLEKVSILFFFWQLWNLQHSWYE